MFVEENEGLGGPRLRPPQFLALREGIPEKILTRPLFLGERMARFAEISMEAHVTHVQEDGQIVHQSALVPDGC